VIISVALHYHVKSAFCIGLLFCTFVWWTYSNDFPKTATARPSFYLTGLDVIGSSNSPLLTCDLIFLYVLYLSGIKTSLSNLADLTRDNGEIPRGRWIFIISGLITIISGFFSGPPILISPESAAGIKAGARTGKHYERVRVRMT
jgi:xanthine/uracil/vitamin C permease (AzgA family)